MTTKFSNHCYMPLDLVRREDKYYIAVLHTPKIFYPEPFFLDSLATRFKIFTEKNTKGNGYDPLVKSITYSGSSNISFIPVKEFVNEFRGQDNSKPKFFIFHIARCGSTLITQMLSTSEKFFVISEPPIINRILDPKSELSKSEVIPLLRAVVQAIALCAPIQCIATAIKFRSWNTLYLSQILAAFFQTPWLFIHRNTAEVLASVLRNPPGWLRSRYSYADFYSSVLSVSNEYINNCDESEFASRLLGAFCKAAKLNESEISYFIDYESLPNALFQVLEQIVAIRPSVCETDLMKESALIYSKDISRRIKYTNDSELKIKFLDPKQIDIAKEFAEIERQKFKKYSPL